MSKHWRGHWRRLAGPLAVFLGGWVVALVWVRLSLDWSDRQAYIPEVSEPRYIVFILIAVAIVAAATTGAFLWWLRRGRASSQAGHRSE